MTENLLEVIVAVENTIGAVVLKILAEGMETAVRGELEVVEEEEDVVHHEEEAGKMLTTTRKKK